MSTHISSRTPLLIACLLTLLSVVAGANPPKTALYYNVLDYGAKRDGSQLATASIKKAIDAAVATGGGTVYFPAGEYLTGPIHLKSNITIFIDAGALIKFSDNFDDYLPMVPSRWEGTNVTNFSPLFYAYKAENIAIVGRGTIDGQGKKWWDYFFEARKNKETRSKWQQEFDRVNPDVIKPDVHGTYDVGFLRPPFIQPMYCKNVRIEGITIQNSPFWTVNPEFCENVTVTGVTINNPPSPNTDGINPESCRYVHISDCHISVGDDCITIKSGKDEDGRKVGVPAENYTITNCTMLSGHGGVVIGSEMSGDVKKITIANCVFDGTDRGIRIKTARGRGGVVEEIRVSNIIMKDIREEAVMMNMQYTKTDPEPVSERTPRFRNIHISGITGNAQNAFVLRGLDEMPIDEVTFSDINLRTRDGVNILNATNVSLHDVRITTEAGPSLEAQNVQHLEIDGFKTLEPHAGVPLMQLKDAQDVYVHGCFPVEGTDTFLQLDGSKTEGVVVEGNNLRHVKTAVRKGDQVVEQAETSNASSYSIP
ncbi:Pectate lyase superfamily protein [Catalinimonas alkaloidigena]|uniref:Pectate lyase superfamily protein n=1 Tax=Catalinimonas alkaloidigena TaxID=1075417 RepID=A0A1G9QHF5_9BACT|nr:glycoside hydrolase family 28 protein [Catalinimonas alkaloidigena]SDM10482.1 Pectate lyase superfamily protein [Catalinimonas alkaloidigena]